MLSGSYEFLPQERVIFGRPAGRGRCRNRRPASKEPLVDSCQQARKRTAGCERQEKADCCSSGDMEAHRASLCRLTMLADVMESREALPGQ